MIIKKIISILIVTLICSSCFKNNSKQAAFSILNNTAQTLVVISCASNGKTTSCFTDNINVNTSFVIREKSKEDAENVPATDMFETIDILKNGKNCTKNWTVNSNWIKTITTEKVTYTLTITDSDF
jgi:hypothetical protein